MSFLPLKQGLNMSFLPFKYEFFTVLFSNFTLLNMSFLPLRQNLTLNMSFLPYFFIYLHFI